VTLADAPFPNSEGLRHGSLQTSGLPARILAPLRAGGLSVLEDLCGPIPECPRLDINDRALLNRVLAFAHTVCDGAPPTLSLPEWLELFLPVRLVDTLQLHYGLQEPAAALSMHEARLRETGSRLGVSRERARQLIGLATGSLRQALPLYAAEPLFRMAQNILHAEGGVITPEALAQRNDPLWGGLSPVGGFLLLTQLVPGRLTLYRDFFSECTPKLIERAEFALRDHLTAQAGLAPIAHLAAALPRNAQPPGVPTAEPMLLALLRHLPDTFATRDGRCGFAARDGAVLLREILAATGESPLRLIGEAFNERVYPECRRGSGYIRDTLGRDEQIRKTSPGHYDLPGGLQTDLPL
jgi:hypothetical protein